MFMAIGLVLSFLIGQIPQIGSMLLPLYIPVFPFSGPTIAGLFFTFIRHPKFLL